MNSHPPEAVSDRARAMLRAELGIAPGERLEVWHGVSIDRTLRVIESALRSQGGGDEADGPAFFERVAETVKEAGLDGDGFWRTCSGCHETHEGHDVGHYPFSAAFNCQLGGGCTDCGGVGAIWDTIDYDGMAREMLASDTASPVDGEGETRAPPPEAD